MLWLVSQGVSFGAEIKLDVSTGVIADIGSKETASEPPEVRDLFTTTLHGLLRFVAVASHSRIGALGNRLGAVAVGVAAAMCVPSTAAAAIAIAPAVTKASVAAGLLV